MKGIIPQSLNVLYLLISPSYLTSSWSLIPRIMDAVILRYHYPLESWDRPLSNSVFWLTSRRLIFVVVSKLFGPYFEVGPIFIDEVQIEYFLCGQRRLEEKVISIRESAKLPSS